MIIQPLRDSYIISRGQCMIRTILAVSWDIVVISWILFQLHLSSIPKIFHFSCLIVSPSEIKLANQLSGFTTNQNSRNSDQSEAYLLWHCFPFFTYAGRRGTILHWNFQSKVEIDFTFPCEFLFFNAIFDLDILVYKMVYNFSMQFQKWLIISMQTEKWIPFSMQIHFFQFQCKIVSPLHHIMKILSFILTENSETKQRNDETLFISLFRRPKREMRNTFFTACYAKHEMRNAFLKIGETKRRNSETPKWPLRRPLIQCIL